MKRECNNGLAI